jgi:hypothetical protein
MNTKNTKIENFITYIGLTIALFIATCLVMVVVQIIEHPELITFGGF